MNRALKHRMAFSLLAAAALAFGTPALAVGLPAAHGQSGGHANGGTATGGSAGSSSNSSSNAGSTGGDGGSAVETSKPKPKKKKCQRDGIPKNCKKVKKSKKR